MKNNIFFESRDLLEKYRAETNPDFIHSLTKISDINDRYQLTPGTEKDFNNAVNFLKYTITKNSKEIDKYETNFSSLFGAKLLKYFNTSLTEDDVYELLKNISEYNKDISDEYKFDSTTELSKLKKILENIYGINTTTLEIKQSSLAFRIYNYLNDKMSEKDTEFIIDENNQTRQNVLSFMVLWVLIHNLLPNTERQSILPSYNNDSFNYNIRIEDNNQAKYIYTDNDGNQFSLPIRKIYLTIANPFDSKNDYNITLGTCQDAVGFNINDLNYSINIEYNSKNYSSDINSITEIVQSNNTPNVKKRFINMAKLINNNAIKLIGNVDDTITITKATDSSGLSTIKINYEFLTKENQKYTFASFFNNTIDEKYTTEIISNYSKVNDEYEIMLNTFKIYTEISNNLDITSQTIADAQETLTKMNADSIETYYALNSYNVVPMILQVYVKQKSKLAELLNSDFGIKVSSDSFFKISLIYKEFNTYIREIDLSYIQNRILGEYIFANKPNILKNKTIINKDIYKVINNPDYGKNIFSEIDRQIFDSTKTNDLIIRNSVVHDIISYISGNIINFGENVSDKEDILKILELYKECREYFYKVLYNLSFTLEDTYDIYVQFFIKAQTIERFVSSRLDNLLNVNQYTAEDCRNFLISFGLKALSDQVDKKKFNNSLEYERRIIADYNEIMSKKGSRSVIDEFFKIFNYDTNEVEIYKYLIFKKNEVIEPAKVETKKSRSKTKAAPTAAAQPISKTSIQFAPAPYYSKNIYHDINTAVQKGTAEPYEKFIKDDQYWSISDLPENKVDSVLRSPVNTKYLGLDLKKDIYYNTVISKYILSINDYLSQIMISDNKRLYSEKCFLFELPDETGANFDITFLYNIIKLLFSLYVYYSEKNNGIELTAGNNNKYLGINTNATWSTTKSKINNILHVTIFDNLFTTYAATFDLATQKYKLSTTPFNYYIKNNNIAPFDRATPNNLFLSNNKMQSSLLSDTPELLPITSIFYDENGNIVKNAISEKKYENFEYSCQDMHSVSPNLTNSSLNIYETAFNSINLINAINNESELKNKTKIFKTIYYFNKYKNVQQYPTNFDEFDLNKNDASNLTLDNFYNRIYNDIVLFPKDYLFGISQNNEKFDYQEKVVLDNIFNDFFLSDKPSISIITKDSNDENIIALIKEIYKAMYIDAASKDQAFDALLKKIFKDNKLVQDIQFTNVNSVSATLLSTTDERIKAIETINNLIVQYSQLLNSIVEGYDFMKLNLETTESANNFFDFIVTSVSFFISYTALLYKQNLIMTIDSKAEKPIITDSFNDEIKNRISEYFYFDEKVSITENDLQEVK